MAPAPYDSTMDLDSQIFGLEDDTDKPDLNQTIIPGQLASLQAGKSGGDRTQVPPSLLFRSPMTTVIVSVKGQDFHLHKELLTRDSFYFDRAFNGDFVEGRDGKVTLEDVQPFDFGFYVDVIYRSHFNPDLVLRKEHTGGSLSTKQILTFWSLCDRFLNENLRRMAKESLEHRLSLYSVRMWQSLARKRPKDDIEGRIGRLQDAYQQCIENDIPFEEDIVEACSNCPAQVYADCVHLLEPNFMAKVSRRIVLRQAGEHVISRKRSAE